VHSVPQGGLNEIRLILVTMATGARVRVGFGAEGFEVTAFVIGHCNISSLVITSSATGHFSVAFSRRTAALCPRWAIWAGVPLKVAPCSAAMGAR
jgi:hypothetical protein